ncbi:hypothetical protein V5O48_007869 [Marasmius crinis-equi]|uniref:DNA polymerase lambda n=1 Tax=Marasmius crinis-equi TaxID=585013 RepID=A0ABR3FFL7_9AGAR
MRDVALSPLSLSSSKDDHDQAPVSSDIPTSPIEDPSAFPLDSSPPATVPLTAGPSLLSMVQGRIATHRAKRKHPKPLQVPQRPSSSEGVMATSSPVNQNSSPPLEKEKTTTRNLKSDIDSKSRSVKHQKTVLDTGHSSEDGQRPKKMRPAELRSLRKLPSEYAKIAIEQYAINQLEDKKKTRKEPQALKGACIFYWGNDFLNACETTKKRMWWILGRGGTLAATYDPAVVTHIVVDGRNNSGSLLKAIKLKSLKEIPDHIPCVTWDWALACKSSKDGQAVLADPFNYAAFSTRLPPVRGYSGPSSSSKSAGKRKAQEMVSKHDSEDEGDSQIEDFSNSNIQAPGKARLAAQSSAARNIKTLPKAASRLPLFFEPEKPVVDDPLAPFEAEARAEAQREQMLGRYGEYVDETDMEDDFSDTDTDEPPFKRTKGFTCDLPGVNRNACPNQDVIAKLQELHDLHAAQPGSEQFWRKFTYTKVIRALKNHPKRIRTIAEARKLEGVGVKTAIKIMEIIETGELRRIKHETTESVQVTRVFQGIYGVGQATALKWYANGCRTLEDLKKGKGGVRLSMAQSIGLKYYNDINERMPRAEAGEIFDLIKPIALSIDPDLFVEIMGSYRRGKADCGDIDILITRRTNDGRTHEGVLSRLLKKLHDADILTEDLALPEDPDDLEAIYRGLCHLPGRKGSKQRRIDFLTVPWKNRGAALLYYTGDDIFNRSMRLKANKMGYSLNQRGLYEGVVRDVQQRSLKTNKGTILASETEQEIFNILGVPWQEPHERVRPT